MCYMGFFTPRRTLNEAKKKKKKKSRLAKIYSSCRAKGIYSEYIGHECTKVCNKVTNKTWYYSGVYYLSPSGKQHISIP